MLCLFVLLVTKIWTYFIRLEFHNESQSDESALLGLSTFDNSGIKVNYLNIGTH